MTDEEFKNEINKYASEIKISITEDEIDKLYVFMNELIETNKYMNLTAITEENEIILKHFIDSILIKKYIKNGENIIDVGTGAGFPGIPLNIVCSENKFTLLDSLNKRIKFINSIVDKINLKNIEAIHSRAEEAGRNEQYREKYDIATSRAVSKLNVLLEYMMPFVKVGGKCICLKGPDIENELKEAENAIKELGGKIKNVEEYTLPKSDNKRTVVIIEKVENTKKQYPRKAGTPLSKPL